MNNKEHIYTPFRADTVGSYLRPRELKKARKAFEKKEITEEQLKDIENKSITDLVKKQKRHGLKVITDGEFRRAYWHLDFMCGFQGVKPIELEHGYLFHDEETTKGSIRLTDKISGENHPFVEHFKFIKQFEENDIIAKQTLPAPAQFLAELFRGNNTLNTLRIYPKLDKLINDIAAAYHTVIMDLYKAGCHNIQFDDCTWGMIVDDNYWKIMLGRGFTLEGEANKYLTVNNMAIANKPEDLVINTHICRGNYHSTYAAQGSYDSIAPYLFAKENVNAYYLEFDDERSGNFEPLKYITNDKKVVLGLITTKSPVLENSQQIIARIHEASQYIPLERLYLSPQCGFASCEIGNKLTEEQQWKKIDLVQSIAKEIWQ